MELEKFHDLLLLSSSDLEGSFTKFKREDRRYTCRIAVQAMLKNMRRKEK